MKTMKTKEQMVDLVDKWNAAYNKLSRRQPLERFTPIGYTDTVGCLILKICSDDADLALTVFNHPHNQGGQLKGDVAGWLNDRRD